MSRLLPLFLTLGVKADQTVQYYYETQELNWNDARDFCRNAGRDLAAPRTGEEATQLFQDRPADFGTSRWTFRGYWIGFTTILDGSQWLDSNGNVPPLQPGVDGFNPMIDNTPGDHCAHGFNRATVPNDPLWGDFTCSQAIPFVCEERRTILSVGVCDGQSTWGDWAPTSQAPGATGFTMHSLCQTTVGAQGRRISLQSALPHTDQTVNLQLDQLSCNDADQDSGSCEPHEARFCCDNTPVSRCPSGCWEEDANGDCVIKDSCQVSVTCDTSGMNIQFPSDFFGAEFEFQDTANCQPALDGANYAYQQPLGQCGSTVTREADENNVDFIVFRKNVQALVRDPVQGTRMIDSNGNVLPIFRDVTSTLFSVSFSCTFPTSMEISAASVAVSGTQAPPTEDQTCPSTHPHSVSDGATCCSFEPAENENCPPEDSQPCTSPPCVDNTDVVITIASTQAPPANWDGSFDLKFYTDDTFATERSPSSCPVNFPHASADGATCCSTDAANCEGGLTFACPNAPTTSCTDYDASNGGIFVGEELFVRAQWTVAGLEDTLRYYISDCDVEDSVTDQSLPIVKSSCYAGAIGAQALGTAATNSKVVTTSSAFKYNAFTFDATSQANTQDLSCTMKFCIWDATTSTSDCNNVVDVGGTGTCPADRGFQYRA